MPKEENGIDHRVTPGLLVWRPRSPRWPEVPHSQTVIDSSSQQGSKPTILDTAPFYRVILFIAWTMLLRDVCPSVRPSHAGILSKRLNIGSNVFTFSYSHTILVSNDMTISDGDHKRGRRMQGVWKISRFSANISLYLGNDTR